MELDFALRLDEHKTIHLTEISRKAFEDQGLSELHSDCGLFVVLEDVSTGAFDVLAKVASQSAGQALVRLLARGFSPRVVHA